MVDDKLRIELTNITARTAVNGGRSRLTIPKAVLHIQYFDDREVPVPELEGHAWYYVPLEPLVTIQEIPAGTTVIRPFSEPTSGPAHLHDAIVLPLMQGAETSYAGVQYQRWFCKGCDAVTLLPADKES